MSREETTTNDAEPHTERKRKRPTIEPENELEIDLNLPEPSSKKARRKEKRGKGIDAPDASKTTADSSKSHVASDIAEAKSLTSQKRSEHGIWIGNLPFTATKDDIRAFLEKEGGITERDIVRLHLPAQSKEAGGKQREQNKGFAYVDFTSAEFLSTALGLSEKLVNGRRVLIKDAKNFEGRPQKPSEATGGDSKKPASKRVFVGNLGFDLTREDLLEHFGRCGDVEDVFLATFEDSGKCKGFGWIRFLDVEAAKNAVRGFYFENDDSEELGGEYSAGERKKAKSKPRKRYVNMLQGRQLRCEFAEDAQTRYNKRFRKDADSEVRSKPIDSTVAEGEPAADNDGSGLHNLAEDAATTRKQQSSKPQRKSSKGDKDQRREERRKRHDARTIAPGKALSQTPRASAAIIQGAGRKITFD